MVDLQSVLNVRRAQFAKLFSRSTAVKLLDELRQYVEGLQANGVVREIQTQASFHFDEQWRADGWTA